MRLPLVLRIIGIVQIGLGIAFIAAPIPFTSFQELAPQQPVWVNWLLAMAGARFVGYGAGMFVAARRPQAHLAWIDTMIGIQAIDWVTTLAYLAVGDLTLRNVTTAAFLPPLFIAALVIWNPCRRRSLRSDSRLSDTVDE